MPRASLEKRPHEVAAMFDEVAAKYDRTNDVLSLGQDRRWRRAVVRALDVRPGEKLLDLAAGTGTSTQPFVDAGVLAVACDFSLGMLRVGRARDPQMAFVAGDATRLPFADGAFDAVTISFGLRNVGDVGAALAEMRRVTRHGCRRWRGGCRRRRTRTCTWRSPSGRGPTSGRSGSRSAPPAGRTSPTGTSPAASWRCTARPAPDRRRREGARRRDCDPLCVQTSAAGPR
jgi:SAM-dependent methyltransferase